jgi:hypothetical protein
LLLPCLLPVPPPPSSLSSCRGRQVAGLG